VKIGLSGEHIRKYDLDLCADSLYMKLTGEKEENLFPLLKREAKGTGVSEQQRDRSPSQDSSEYSFEKATMV
jgi:hypothetical protein